MMAGPLRGEVWNADLDPSRGHEQAGRRPVLVISTDGFNSGPAELAVVLPITSKRKGIPWHVPVKAGDAGLRSDSYIMCEMIRSVAWDRLSRRLGEVSDSILREVETRLKILLQM
jgi:mRNA interferase MazF